MTNQILRPARVCILTAEPPKSDVKRGQSASDRRQTPGERGPLGTVR